MWATECCLESEPFLIQLLTGRVKHGLHPVVRFEYFWESSDLEFPNAQRVVFRLCWNREGACNRIVILKIISALVALRRWDGFYAIGRCLGIVVLIDHLLNKRVSRITMKDLTMARVKCARHASNNSVCSEVEEYAMYNIVTRAV